MSRGPFGDEIRYGEKTVEDDRGIITIGRLAPLPVYVVRVAVTGINRTRIIWGAAKAVRWANRMWEAAG